jgi:3-hydroxyisobutyrate dehydrogenase
VAPALAAELGCQACVELKQVTKLSDVIITVVPDDAAMKAIYGGGLLNRAKGKLFINCATVTPEVHSKLEQKAPRPVRNRSKPAWRRASARRGRASFT